MNQLRANHTTNIQPTRQNFAPTYTPNTTSTENKCIPHVFPTPSLAEAVPGSKLFPKIVSPREELTLRKLEGNPPHRYPNLRVVYICELASQPGAGAAGTGSARFLV